MKQFEKCFTILYIRKELVYPYFSDVQKFLVVKICCRMIGNDEMWWGMIGNDSWCCGVCGVEWIGSGCLCWWGDVLWVCVLVADAGKNK